MQETSGENISPLEVRGKITISPKVKKFSRATAHIYLEDISYADATAEVLTELVLKDISHGVAKSIAETVIDFKLSVPPVSVINPRNDYSVRVWIDLDGDGKKGKGDLHSNQTYPVLTYGRPNEVNIKIG